MSNMSSTFADQDFGSFKSTGSNWCSEFGRSSSPSPALPTSPANTPNSSTEFVCYIPSICSSPKSLTPSNTPNSSTAFVDDIPSIWWSSHNSISIESLAPRPDGWDWPAHLRASGCPVYYSGEFDETLVWNPELGSPEAVWERLKTRRCRRRALNRQAERDCSMGEPEPEPKKKDSLSTKFVMWLIFHGQDDEGNKIKKRSWWKKFRGERE